MAYNEELAERVRLSLSGRQDVAEKKMFGGLAFMVGGSMACGVMKDDLMVRVGPDGHQEALAEPHARPTDFTGRPMKGMVYVGPEGYRTDEALAGWVKRGAEFAASLPPAPRKRQARAKRG